ncbi:MAG: hypothetical protein V3U92_02160 [Cellulophaga sp.]
MKKHYTILFLLFIVLQFSCKHDNKHDNSKYSSKSLELIKIVNSNPEIKSMLLASIEKAKQISPDKKTNPAQNLEEYYEFVSWSENAMPWQFLELDYANTLYDKIDQSLCYFFFINDQPIDELEEKGYFNNSLQYHEPYKSWLTSFNKTYGKYMNSEESWNSDYYQIALSDGIFSLQNDWYESPSNWKTFNQFFARHLQSPKKRPIAEIDNQDITHWNVASIFC